MLRKLLFVTGMSCLLFSGPDAADVTAPKPTRAATGSATHSVAAAISDTLVVMARLAEVPGKFPPNDLYNYVYIMKYRVLKVEKGEFGGTDLLVGHYNPLIARKSVKDKMDPVVDGTVERFVVGAKHRLTLVTPVERVWKDAVEDEYVDVDGEKYFALKADLVP